MTTTAVKKKGIGRAVYHKHIPDSMDEEGNVFYGKVHERVDIELALMLVGYKKEEMAKLIPSISGKGITLPVGLTQNNDGTVLPRDSVTFEVFEYECMENN